MVANDGNTDTLTTIDTAFDIIEILHEKKSMDLTELANELNIAISTAHYYLVTLTENGYVIKNKGKYRIGLKFLDHGIKTRQNYTITAVVQSTLNQIAEETGEASWYVEPERGSAVFLEKAIGDQAVQTIARIGMQVPLHCVAEGKAILAYMDDDKVDEIIDRYGLPERTHNTITDRDKLYQELEEIATQGYALSDEESTEGARAVGAPIVVNETVQGAISVAGPANRMKGDRYRQKLPNIVSGATNEIELRLMHEY